MISAKMVVIEDVPISLNFKEINPCQVSFFATVIQKRERSALFRFLPG